MMIQEHLKVTQFTRKGIFSTVTYLGHYFFGHPKHSPIFTDDSYINGSGTVWDGNIFIIMTTQFYRSKHML